MNPLFLSAVSLRQSIYVNICQRTVCPIDVIVLILSIYGYITYKENPKDQNWELKEFFLENQVFLTFPKEKMTF